MEPLPLQILSLAEIRRRLAYSGVIDCMRDALIATSRGECETPMPMHLDIPPGAEVHMKSSYRQGGRYFALKVAATFPANLGRGLPTGNGMMLLSSAATGEPVAFLADGGHLTDVRTAAVSAMVARELGRRDTAIGILGTGIQAQTASNDARRSPAAANRVDLGPQPGACRGAAGDLRELADVRIAGSPAELAREVRLIVTATGSRSPLLADDAQRRRRTAAAPSPSTCTTRRAIPAPPTSTCSPVPTTSATHLSLQGLLSPTGAAGARERITCSRPTTLERGPRASTRASRLAPGRRQGDAFYQKRVPKGAPDYVETANDHLPLRAHRRRGLPDRDRGAGLGRADGHADLPPLAGAPRRPDHPDELRIDLDPHGAPASATRSGSPASPARCSPTSAWSGSRRPVGNRGVHVYVRIEPRWDFVDVRHAAIAFGRELERRTTGVTTSWWKEERGDAIFVDYNQNARDRTIASAYSLRPKPGAPVSTPMDVGRARRGRGPARTTTCSRCRSGSPSAATCTPPSTTWRTRPRSRCSTCSTSRARRRAALPAGLPEDAGRAAARAASKKVAAHWDDEA